MNYKEKILELLSHKDDDLVTEWINAQPASERAVIMKDFLEIVNDLKKKYIEDYKKFEQVLNNNIII